MSSRPGAASSDSDADDDAFVKFVREHVSNAMRARRASASDDDDARARDESTPREREDETNVDENDDPVTPVRPNDARATTVRSEAERVMSSARASARKMRVETETSASRMKMSETARRAEASARRLATTMATTSATRKSLVMVGDGDDDDDVRTPVRVGHGGIGTLRSTHMMEDAETRAARQRETTTTTTTMTVRRASMTPPQALRMSLMSPKPPTTVRVASSSTMDVDARALVVAGGMNAKAVEFEVEQLRAKVTAIQRDLEAMAIEKQTWLNERVRMGAMISATEEDLKTTEARMSKTESRLMAMTKQRDEALDETERLQEALANARREHESALKAAGEEYASESTKLEFSVRDYSIKIERLEMSLQETETKIHADESTIQNLEASLAASATDLRDANAKLENYQVAQATMEGEAENFKLEIARLSEALATSEEKIVAAVAEFQAQQTKQNEKSSQFEILESENARLKEDIVRLNETVTMTNSTMLQKDAAIDAAQAETERARVERGEVADEVIKLRAEIIARESVIENEKRIKEETIVALEDTRAALQTKTSECRNFETELESLKVEMSTLRIKLEKESKKAMTTEEKSESAKEAFAARLAAAAEKQAGFQGRMLEMKSSLEAEKKKLEAQARAEIESGTAELKSLRQKLAEKEAAYEAVSQNAILFEEKLEVTLEQLSEAKSALSDLKSKLAEKEFSNVEFSHLNEELQAANAKLKLMEVERSEHVLELKSAREEVLSLEGKVAGLETAADLAGSETEELRKKLHVAEQEISSMADEHELESSMAAKANMIANSQVTKLEKQVGFLNKEIEILREKHASSAKVERDRDSSSAVVAELHRKLEAAESRIVELAKELGEWKASAEESKKSLDESERRLKAECEVRVTVETELEEVRRQFAAAESRVYEVNTELLLLNKELEKEKVASKNHSKTDAGELREAKASRDAALAKVKDLTIDLTKVTAERDLLQQSITSMEKRLELERLAFAAQVKNAVKDAVQSKDKEMLVIRKELDTIRQMSASGDHASEALSKALDDKQHELSQARESISELRANYTSLQHQLEHANELLATARRDASMTQEGDYDELRKVRAERDEAKSTMRDLESQLSDAVAAKVWLEKHSAATEAELKASKEALAAANKMSEHARTQLARYQNNSPSLISPKKSRSFGSPLMQTQLASPLKWFSRQTNRTVARTPPNNLFNKFTLATPTAPTRTPGGSWRVPSRPETLNEAVQMLVTFFIIVSVVLLFLTLTAMFAPNETLRRISVLPPSDSTSCGVLYRFNDLLLEIGHGLIRREYRSLCAGHPPS